VKRTRGGQGRLDEPREPAPSLDADAADGLVRVDVLVEDQPVRVARRLLAAVADLVRDGLGVLLVGGVAGVDGAADGHPVLSVAIRSSTMMSARSSSQAWGSGPDG